MSIPIVSMTEVKAYLGITTFADDALLASISSNATSMAERDTGRVFAVTSNVTRRYSTDGQASITIHDHPYNDATRVVKVNGVTMTEGTNVWFLPDRRNGDVSITLQFRFYDTSVPRWFTTDPNWFDANLDNPRYLASAGSPNDVLVTGTEGHPQVTGDVKEGVLELIGWLYQRAKGGVSGFGETLTGTDVDLSLLPMAYQLLVRNWRIRTAVAIV